MDVLAELSEAVIMYTERAKRERDAPASTMSQTSLRRCCGDRGNVCEQVFINVIDNALKYSDRRRIPSTVSAAGGGRQHRHRVWSGHRRAASALPILPKIKTKFYKANHTRPGSGIGLALADEIIRLHERPAGRRARWRASGTTVTITLPIMERDDDSTQIAEAAAEAAAPPSDAAVHLNKLDLSDMEHH